MKKLLVLAALLGLTTNACLQGDLNPYDNVGTTGGTGGTGGTSTNGLRRFPATPGSECSVNGATSVSLSFDNRTTKTLSVYWVDYSCTELFYEALAPASTYTIPSYAGHPFRLRDEAGILSYEYIPSGEASQTIVLD